jgi:translation initiation factor 6 (eIF-6)
MDLDQKDLININVDPSEINIEYDVDNGIYSLTDECALIAQNSISSTWDHWYNDPLQIQAQELTVRDIQINGTSLVDTLAAIQQQLNILVPDPELEQQWHQLRALGDQYRQLQRELQEKTRVWNAISR